MEIAVYGSGCKKCQALLGSVKEAVANAGVDAQVDYVTDMAAIASKGIMSTPALAIDGKVVSMGRVLDAASVQQLIAGVHPAPANDACSCGGSC